MGQNGAAKRHWFHDGLIENDTPSMQCKSLAIGLEAIPRNFILHSFIHLFIQS